MTTLLAGLGLGFSLIVAIGAQNLFVLRQGIRREHVALVAAICTVSDMTLIVIGISGIGAATQALPWLEVVVRWAGAVFLVGYGVLAARRSLRSAEVGLQVDPDSEPDPTSGAGSVATQQRTQTSAAAVALTTLALTWLNPHVYLDTVLLLGTIANHEGPTGRWWFAVGAGLASILWFSGLGFGARYASPLLARPRAWQVLDVLIGVVMLLIALQLATG